MAKLSVKVKVKEFRSTVKVRVGFRISVWNRIMTTLCIGKIYSQNIKTG